MARLLLRLASFVALLTFALLYCGLWLLVMTYATWRLAGRRGAAAPVPLPTAWPCVSILVAARNEEANLPRCLASLRALDYPAHLLEILVGDDASTDGTRAVAEAALAGFAGAARVLRGEGS